MIEYIKSVALLLTLLNPFLIIVYLVDIVKKLTPKQFRLVLLRAGAIAGSVYCAFAIIGDTFFSEILQVQFASFQIFGGIVFLLIGIQFVFKGPLALEMLNSKSEHLAGSIAMPVLIGPGTISASIIIGEKLDPIVSCIAISIAVIVCLTVILLLKYVHDWVHHTREELIEQYFEIAGRLTALYVGTVAVEMIMLGVRTWIDKF